MSGRPNIYPSMYYRDAPAAIEFLRTAFGFEPVLLIPGENGAIDHAELRLGAGIVMLGTAGRHEGTASPSDLGGRHGGVCVTVGDVAAHCRVAKAAGAHITRELATMDYGTGYSATDREGHEWHFSDYDPGKALE